MDVDVVIDDLNGLVDYLSAVDPEDMSRAELADWRRRLDAARDCLSEIESDHEADPDDEVGDDPAVDDG
jgi:hypothetical protein